MYYAVKVYRGHGVKAPIIFNLILVYGSGHFFLRYTYILITVKNKVLAIVKYYATEICRRYGGKDPFIFNLTLKGQSEASATFTSRHILVTVKSKVLSEPKH
jgi:hypothetical protein